MMVTTPILEPAWKKLTRKDPLADANLFNQGQEANERVASQMALLAAKKNEQVAAQSAPTVGENQSVGQESTSFSPMDRLASQNGIFSTNAPVTQRFGNKSSIEQFSGGVNRGTDFGVPRGTRVAVPQGEWKVIEAFDKSTQEGSGNTQKGTNRGYGNSVLLQNTRTGEKLRYSHLRVGGVGVQPGQIVKEGQVIGETGATGNVWGKTGQHLDLEYYNALGQIADVLATEYAKYL